MQQFQVDRERLSQLRRERAEISVYLPVSDITVRSLIDSLQLGIWLDLRALKVSINRPGDYRFDFHEAQTKLYMKCGGLEGYKNLLKKYGLSFPLKKDTTDKSALLFTIAAKEGIVLDARMAGFTYNSGASDLMFMAIRTDGLVEMARKYARIERDSAQIQDVEHAKRYLENLAEKYFYHEVGHFIYGHTLTQTQLSTWDNAVRARQDIVERVYDIQRDKHPSKESIPVENEAFADIFSALVQSTRHGKRLGNQPALENLATEMLEQIGCRI